MCEVAAYRAGIVQMVFGHEMNSAGAPKQCGYFHLRPEPDLHVTVECQCETHIAAIGRKREFGMCAADRRAGLNLTFTALLRCRDVALRIGISRHARSIGVN